MARRVGTPRWIGTRVLYPGSPLKTQGLILRVSGDDVRMRHGVMILEYDLKSLCKRYEYDHHELERVLIDIYSLIYLLHFRASNKNFSLYRQISSTIDQVGLVLCSFGHELLYRHR